MNKENVFVTGRTGVLGRRVIARLVAQGYSVVALARSKQKEEELTKLGVVPVSGSIYDQNRMHVATYGCGTILHLATSIPCKSLPRRRDWRENDRLRTDATDILINCCLANNIPKMIVTSLVHLLEDIPTSSQDSPSRIPKRPNQLLESARKMENKLISASNSGLDFSILRYGTFYSRDSYHTQKMVASTQKGKIPMIGDGQFYMNFIHADDAASAMVYTLDHFETLKNRVFHVTDFQQ